MRLVALFVVCIAAAGCRKAEAPQSMITVNGIGTVLAQPDMARLSVSLSSVDGTTRQAQTAVNIMVGQVLGLLKEAAIEDKDIGTSSLRFSAEYEWGSGRQVFIGQRVEQVITFAVHNIKEDAGKVPLLLDKITAVNSIALNQVEFSIKDTTELYTRSRELAYRKALDKATQYAALSGLKIIKVANIAEVGAPQLSPMSNALYNQLQYAADESFDAGSTLLPTGELEITTHIAVSFLLE